MKSIKQILEQKYKNSTRDIILEGADLLSEKGYTLVPNFVFQTKLLTGKAKLVYAMLLSYAWGNKDSAFPGQERLAADCGNSVRSIYTAIKELETNGFITVIRRGLGRTNLYVLHIRKDATKANEADRK